MPMAVVECVMLCRGGYSTESMYENVGSAGDMEEILTAYVDAGMHHTILF
jgi:hypothetical protein